jgi:hypothetical protein
MLAVYALLPEQYRFSRGIVLFGAILAFILISILRWVLTRGGVISSGNEKKDHANTLVVGSAEEYKKVLQLMEDAGMKEKVLGRVAVNENDPEAIGYWSRLDAIYQSVPFNEIIICEGSLSFKNIIESLQRVKAKVKIKIHAASSQSIVGSDSKDTAGESLSKENGFRLANPYNRRLKRLVDVCIALAGLVSFPIQLVAVRKPISFFGNCIAVLFGRKTWIGYSASEKNLPSLRKAVIACNGIPVSIKQELPKESLLMLDYWYARDYEPATDLKLVWKIYRRLGD